MNKKIKRLATKEEIKALVRKVELKAEQNKIPKLQTYDLSNFVSQSYFVHMEHNILETLY